jgi:hypothetical protein
VSASLSRRLCPRRSSGSSVVVAGDEHTVAAGRLGQPVDFFAQRKELAAGLPQRLDQLGVALGELRDRRGGLSEALLEQPDVPG